MFISTIKNKVISNLPFIILILILGTYLSIKALPENSWDGWSQGSSQALLSNKHWVNDGFLKSYLLFLPQGYSKVVRYFDDPELRQHAHGTQAGDLIGQRLYYTHYPSGYLLPTALLMKAGVENRFWFRFLEILFSLGSLVFLYWFLTMIYNRIGAFLGALFFGMSIMFWNYADSLANQPIDALLSSAIVALSVAAIKNQKKYFNFLIWILYFILAFSSYDSTFFVFAWLVGLDLIIKKEINLKKWAVWALAPVLAFGLQILQNTLYLGWHDMLVDLYGVYNVRVLGKGMDFTMQIIRFISPFDRFFGSRYPLGVLIAIAGFFYARWLVKNNTALNKYLILSGIATLFNFLIFPPNMFYQGRLISIFGGLVMAIITLETMKVLRNKTELTKNIKLLYIAAFIIILGLWLIQAQRSYAYYKHRAANDIPQKNVEYDKKIKNLVAGDKIIIQMLGLDRELPPSDPHPPYVRPQKKIAFRLYDNHTNIPGIDPYPQIWTQDEYYVGSPILGFARTSDLIRDLGYLKKRSEFPFSAIILSDQKEVLEKIREDIMIKKISQNNLKILELESDKFALIVPET